MSNTLITPTIIAREALMLLENNLVMANNVHREYRKEWDGIKKGSTVNIRRPVWFDVTDGTTLTKQDVQEANTSIVIDQRKHVSWGFVTQDLTLSVEAYRERYIKPAMIALANKVDSDLCGLYDDVPNWVGTPGQDINSFSDLSVAPERLDEFAVPEDGNRNCVLSPNDYWAMTGNLTGLQIEKDARSAYRKGYLGNVAGLNVSKDQNVVSHTTGAYAGSAGDVNGASQNVAYSAVTQATWSQTLDTDQWNVSAAIFTAGDIITLASVNAVNPVPGESSKQDTGFSRQFVVLNAATSDSSGEATITISPPIITSGPYQTCSAAPANNATITHLGTASTAYKQNMAFHRDAFALVVIPLEMPDGASFKARETTKDGTLSIRVVKDYDIINDEDVIRLDILYGIKTLTPDLATRVSGTA